MVLFNWQQQPDDPQIDEVSEANPLFVYIKIPADLDPFDRCPWYADPLQEALERENMGTVTGGGTMFSEPDEDGEDEVLFSGIDVDLFDLRKGMELLRRELIRLEIPKGTTLVYRIGGKEHEEPLYSIPFPRN